ncbi:MULTISPECIES: DUF481 domain-containing protein [Salegentibacter]|uniref:DUF481 domain-containing protein n=1 Tax=Salegentibacter agarivorans TaxID=345907 RepID=A0A1I2LSM9_9FLAO|nr:MULTISPECIES: DUF481 domain-containing protein [Salegentibacter]APS37809.1 hypothetical protein AO058_02450 [Salegentibacter sp. T436]SFF82113.1 Protein of unknown function, DUF481 [Salegentibacter agarivorans]
MHWRFLLLFLLLPFLGQAQLVNIETKRLQTDSTRFVLNADFAFNHSNNDGVSVNQINGTLTTQLKSKDLKKTYLFLGNYRLIDADEGNLQNSWFLHTRFNYKFNQLLRFEAFLQGQYNQLLVVEQRNLVGAGLRLKWMNRENFSGYLGNSYMYEVEYSDRAGTTEYKHRNSTYLSVSYLSKSKNFSVTNTVYYQPLYKNLKDYRLLEQFRLDIPLAEWFKVFTIYDYYFDSKTPLNTREYTSQLQIGVGFSF